MFPRAICLPTLDQSNCSKYCLGSQKLMNSIIIMIPVVGLIFSFPRGCQKRTTAFLLKRGTHNCEDFLLI